MLFAVSLFSRVDRNVVLILMLVVTVVGGSSLRGLVFVEVLLLVLLVLLLMAVFKRSETRCTCLVQIVQALLARAYFL